MDSQNPQNSNPAPAPTPSTSQAPAPSSAAAGGAPEAARPFVAYSSFAEFEKLLETYLVEKAPFQLPNDLKDFFVKVLPWISLVMLMISLPLVFAAVGCSAILAPLGALGGGEGVHSGTMLMMHSLLAAVIVFCYGMGLPGLFKRSRAGWAWNFYAKLLGVVSTVLSLSIGGLLFSVVWFYALFQIKDRYQ